MDGRRAWPGGLTAGLAAGLLVLAAVPGCIVEPSYGQCAADRDCPGGEVCKLSTGQCYLQCRTDADCYLAGQPIGKSCRDSRCVFASADRVPAPEFCLQVINPANAHHGKQLCLSQLRGKVVLIYFGLLG